MSEDAPVLSHLDELRRRLVISAIAIGCGFVLCYVFKQHLFHLLVSPLMKVMKSGETMVYTSLPEAFFTYIKVSLLAGIMLASPVIFYQFWMFVGPGLYPTERRAVLPIVILSSFFFIAGALFGYFVVFPLGFEFFLSFATENIRPLPSMKEYFSFSSKLLLAFGFAFELPLVLTGLARLGIVTPVFLKKNRKYAILIFFAGAAIMTPPDVVSQVMMGVPLMFLYELSIFGAKIFGKKTSVNGDDADGEDADDDAPDPENKQAGD